MCDNILELIAVIFGAAEISAAIVIASMFLGCFQQFKFPQLTIDQIIALTASVGSLAAAVATYLTVREMKAGRVLGARARLTTPGTDQQIAFAWARAPKNYVQSPSKVRIIIRNASQGVAHKIRLNWRLENPIDAAGLKDIQRWLPDGQSVNIVGGHSAQFCDADIIGSVLAVGGESSAYLGDLGPNQEAYADVPEVILNSIFLKWMQLLTTVADGGSISFEQVPSVEMNLDHSSPYEGCIVDSHRVRFELIDEKFKLRAVKSPTEALGGGWKNFELTLAFETTSRTMYEIPRVVV